MNTTDFDGQTRLWLDKLACGELDPTSRGKLLAWLDAEPLRWRSCALALLEAQAWNEALEERDLPAPGCSPSAQRDLESRFADSARGSHRRWSSLAALAAVVLVAFALGALSRGWGESPAEFLAGHQPASEIPPAPPESGPLMATVALRPDLGPQIPATLQIPVVPLGKANLAAASTTVSDYERLKWERRGYQLTKERRFLPAQLPNGKKVVVPVEQVKVNYVGSKVS